MAISDDPILGGLLQKLALDDEWLDTPNENLPDEDGSPMTPRFAASRGCPMCRYAVLKVLETMAGERAYPRISDLI